MSISFKKSMLAVTIITALTAGISNIATAAPADHVPTALNTGADSTPGNPLWLIAGGHNGGHDHGHEHGGREFGGRGHFGFRSFMSGYGNDGMYQDWPTECNGLTWRLERHNVPYWREQAILANHGCV